MKALWKRALEAGVVKALEWRTRAYLACKGGSLGPGSLAFGRLRVYNKGSIRIGARCDLVGACWRYRNHVDPVSMYAMRRQAEIVIGDHCYIVGSHFHINYGLTIEDDVIIAPGVRVIDHDHHLEPWLRFAQSFPGAPIRIGKGAWIGFNAIILKGVTIGQHAVVGAGSVVVSDVPDFCVAAGVPARVIKQLPPQAEPSRPASPAPAAGGLTQAAARAACAAVLPGSSTPRPGGLS